MADARGRRKYPITIGELFPDGDIVGQWVFAVTELAEDLVYVLPSLTAALGARFRLSGTGAEPLEVDAEAVCMLRECEGAG